MHISFTPMRREDRLELSKADDVLTINGETFDFSPLSEGSTLPQDAVSCDWLASDVVRVDGVIQLTLILPHGANAGEETLFPAPIEALNGPILLPPYTLDDREV
ncbi:hypothetical protein [Phaeobacter sp. NW0010-22]|uniref:hypothetical protein n=1 Tax=Phaeobacter sp. NW0010-22 TaxID=3135907 RepID=UPI0031066845